MSSVIAIIDLDQVSLYDEADTAIDFYNEIDIWAKIEFQSREQISRLRNKKSPNKRPPRSPHATPYSFRDEKK